jgi:hypothetical protein
MKASWPLTLAIIVLLAVVAMPPCFAQAPTPVGFWDGAANVSTNQDHFTLYNHDTHQAFLDLGDPGPSVGDQYVFGGDVSKQQGGTPIGRMSGQCVTISDTEMLCTSSFTFNGDQISFQALVDVTVFFAGQPFEFAVTGGTGSYRKARGTVTGQILPEPPSGSDARFTVDLE